MAQLVMARQLVFIDLETGGSNPKRHPIIQMAAVAVGEDLKEIEAFEVKIRFSERLATSSSLRKASYSRAQWDREAIDPRFAAREFVRFLRRYAVLPVTRQDASTMTLAQLVAHNAAYDSAFLQAWFDKLSIYCPARFQYLCMLQRVEWYFAENPALPRPDNFKLLTLCRYFRVPLHPMEAHEALADVRATIGLYRALHKAEADTVASMPQFRSSSSQKASRFAAAS